MKYGANTFIFTSPFSTEEDLGLVNKLKGMGLDLIEVAVEDPALVDLDALKAALTEHEMGVVVCGAFGPDRNRISQVGIGQEAGCSLPVVEANSNTGVGDVENQGRPVRCGATRQGHNLAGRTGGQRGGIAASRFT